MTRVLQLKRALLRMRQLPEISEDFLVRSSKRRRLTRFLAKPRHISCGLRGTASLRKRPFKRQ
jgi:hypothetical protein